MGEDLISRLCGEGETPLCRADVTVSELLYTLAIRAPQTRRERRSRRAAAAHEEEEEEERRRRREK